MGLFDKIKNVLFEEETIEIPLPAKEEVKREVTRELEVPAEIRLDRDIEATGETVVAKKPALDDTITEINPRKYEQTSEVEVLERDEFANKKTFEFPVFDESDFDNTLELARSSSNVLERERSEASNKRVDFGKYETKPSKPKEEVKTFKPTPVISPVYGILDQNYKKEDIVQKQTDNSNIVSRRPVDIDRVRTKAFGTLEDAIDLNITEPIEIVKEIPEIEVPKLSPTKTIDELLMDSIDDSITIGEMARQNTSEEIISDDEVLEDVASDKDLTETLSILNDIESELDKTKISKPKTKNLDDTLESDLFNLIDSMYDNKEGEE